MPLYEFRCLHCDHRFEELLNREADPPACPVCQGAGERLLSRPSFRFKGAGFHCTDYGRYGPRSKTTLR